MSAIEKKLVDLYFANLDLIEEGVSPVINRYRGDAIQAFNLLGLPSKRIEKYKYTDISARYDADFEQFFTPFGKWNEAWKPLIEGARVIRLLNGYSYGSETLTTLENGVVYGSLREAAERLPELVGKYYNQLADNDSDAITSLNTAFVQDGAFVYIPRGVTVEEPFVVLQGYGAEESTQVYGRSLVVAGENAEANVVFQSQAANGNAFLINQVVEIFAADAARVEAVEIVSENDRSTHLSNRFVLQSGNSRVQAVSVLADGGVVRSNLSVCLAGKGAENHTHGLFIADTGQHLDCHTQIEHRVSDCSSFEDFRGVASGSGVGAFNGRILVCPDAQRTQAFQANHNLLLSDEAAIYTKPQLEIYADDVKCSHGATVGQLDPEAIFYMRQRGIGEEEARKLQMYGFVRTIIEKLSVRELADAVDALVTAKIDRL